MGYGSRELRMPSPIVRPTLSRMTVLRYVLMRQINFMSLRMPPPNTPMHQTVRFVFKKEGRCIVKLVTLVKHWASEMVA